jgi:hypothetical protein
MTSDLFAGNLALAPNLGFQQTAFGSGTRGVVGLCVVLVFATRLACDRRRLNPFPLGSFE